MNVKPAPSKLKSLSLSLFLSLSLTLSLSLPYELARARIEGSLNACPQQNRCTATDSLVIKIGFYSVVCSICFLPQKPAAESSQMQSLTIHLKAVQIAADARPSASISSRIQICFCGPQPQKLHRRQFSRHLEWSLQVRRARIDSAPWLSEP